MDIKKYCKELHNSKKSFAFIYQIKKDNMTEKIINATSFLKDTRISARVYCILHDIFENPKCECGKELQFNQYSEGFRQFCSVKCSANSDYKQDKIKQTNIEKYGHINSFHSINGRKEWIKYRSDPIKVFEAAIKGKETLKENYGVETIEEAQKIRIEKALEAKIDKYGFAFNNREKANKSRNEEKIQNKLRETCLKKYGETHHMKNSNSFEYTTSKLFKKKEYVFPSGRIDIVQGYEPFALNKLLDIYEESDIITNIKLLPKIVYLGVDGKEHRYYPDIFIPKNNLIIEVKSEYTMKANFKVNKLKEKASKNAGFSFKFMIFNKNGDLLY